MLKALHTLRNSYEKNWPELHAALTGSIPSFIYSRRPSNIGSSIPVFCYHLFEAADFEADLRFLKRNGYVTLDAQGLVDHVEGSKLAPPQSVVLTVDDGARNLCETGFPLLEKYAMKVVAFIVPRFHAEKFSAAKSDGALRPCTWPELRSMHASGLVDIQSHTYEHRYIPRWPESISLTGADQELINSMRGPAMSIEDDFRLAKETIERKLDKPVQHLCFVKYQGSDEAIRIGREIGYRSFWWGYLPRHSGNCPGQSPARVARIDATYLRRLPGESRKPLKEILGERCGATAARMWGRAASPNSDAATRSDY